MSQSFGEFIKELREQKGLSLNQLAGKSGVSNAQISRIENGLRELPRPETIKKLASGLETSQTLLMEKAGYFEGLEEEKKEPVKRFFEIHEELDGRIHKLIREYLSVKSIEDILVILKDFSSEEDVIDFIDEKGMQPADSLESIVEFVDYLGTDMEIKSDIINLLEKEVEKLNSESSSHVNNHEKELFDNSLDLTDTEIKDRYSFKIDGRDLTDDEFARMIAQVRLERQLRDDQK